MEQTNVDKTHWSKKLLFASLSIIFLLIILELGLRVTGLASPSVGVIYKDMLVKGRPGATVVNLKENKNTFTFNNMGFHDRDRKAKRSKGYRYLFLGDSFTEGAQVELDKLFTIKLEELFKNDSAEIEVINGALSGANSAKEYLLWREFFRSRVDHDHVVLMFYEGNDLVDNLEKLSLSFRNVPTGYSNYIAEDGTVYTIKPGYSFFGLWARKVCNYSAFANLIYTRLYLLKRAVALKKQPENQSMSPQAQSAVADNSDLWMESVRRTKLMIEQWNNELLELDKKLTVVIIPRRGKLINSPIKERYNDMLLHQLKVLSKAKGFNVIQLAFEGIEPSDIFFQVQGGFGHFNEHGHALVAEQLYDKINVSIEG